MQRLALLAFGAFFILLFVIFAIAQGIGNPSVPSGAVAIVEDVPDDLGTVTDAEFHHALVKSAASVQIKPIPKPGDPQYDGLEESALRELLDPIWMRGQAAEMGVSATPKEVAEELETLKKNYKTAKEYEEFLKQAHYTKADIEMIVETQILSAKVQEKVAEKVSPPNNREIEDYYEAAKSSKYTTPGSGLKSLDEVRPQISKKLAEEAEQQASNAFVVDYIDRWASRTFCAAGFAVVTHCSNLVADGRPPESNAACYESSSDGGVTEPCEAPIPQVKPAQPGSVSPMNPEGLKLAQAPRPGGFDLCSPIGGTESAAREEIGRVAAAYAACLRRPLHPPLRHLRDRPGDRQSQRALGRGSDRRRRP